MILLLLGPSGVGKSTLIQSLGDLDPRFMPAPVLTTRSVRAGEVEKTSVSEAVMHASEQRGDLLMLNELYGTLYGTPRRPFDEALESGRFPTIDWPVDRVDLMRAAFPDRIFAVYLTPPSIDELRRRLQIRGEVDSNRFEAGVVELERFYAGYFEGKFDMHLVSETEKSDELARTIRAGVILASEQRILP